MPAVGMKVTGLTKIIKNVEKRIAAETWRDVMERAMNEALETARRLCPVDTGKMRDSIQGQVTGNFSYELTVGVKYASFNEWGWRGIPSVGSVENPVFYKGGYRPFIRPAVWIVNKYYKKYIKQIIFGGHFY